MTFISLNYLFLFLPVVVGLYYVFRTSFVANIIILGASYYFYAATTQWYLIPLIITSLLDFAVGILMSRTDHSGTEEAYWFSVSPQILAFLPSLNIRRGSSTTRTSGWPRRRNLRHPGFGHCAARPASRSTPFRP